MAFAHDDGVEVVPVALRREGARLWIGVDRNVHVNNGTPQPAVVLVDDGRYWFELRAVTWRGRLVPAPPPPLEPSELRWFELLAEAAIAWNYAALHEEP
jgi:hypothetical protein